MRQNPPMKFSRSAWVGMDSPNKGLPPLEVDTRLARELERSRRISREGRSFRFDMSPLLKEDSTVAERASVPRGRVRPWSSEVRGPARGGRREGACERACAAALRILESGLPPTSRYPDYYDDPPSENEEKTLRVIRQAIRELRRHGLR